KMTHAWSARLLLLAPLVLLDSGRLEASHRVDPLPSWRDGAAERSIVDFVAAVTREGSPSWVPPAERVAVFDNDGTLWTEQPIPVELQFAIDRVRALAPSHPEWKGRQPFDAALSDDLETLAKGGDEGIMELVAATHAGMTTDEFTAIVRDWLRTA